METLKTGFGAAQFGGFMQPFDGGLYTGYSTYNNWDTAAAKMSSPLASKPFTWGLNAVNPLPPVVTSQPPMCFPPPPPVANHCGTVGGAGGGVVPGMNMHHQGNMSGGGAAAAGSCPFASPPPCPPYLYNRDQCSSSIASLRLKAKQHSTSFPYSSVTGRQPPTLSACQYAGVGNATGLA